MSFASLVTRNDQHDIVMAETLQEVLETFPAFWKGEIEIFETIFHQTSRGRDLLELSHPDGLDIQKFITQDVKAYLFPPGRTSRSDDSEYRFLIKQESEGTFGCELNILFNDIREFCGGSYRLDFNGDKQAFIQMDGHVDRSGTEVKLTGPGKGRIGTVDLFDNGTIFEWFQELLKE